jgi:hypothetical protein
MPESQGEAPHPTGNGREWAHFLESARPRIFAVIVLAPEGQPVIMDRVPFLGGTRIPVGAIGGNAKFDSLARSCGPRISIPHSQKKRSMPVKPLEKTDVSPTPLRKRNLEDGKLYTRVPEVEESLKELLSQPRDEAVRRCEIQDANDPEFVPSEGAAINHVSRSNDRAIQQ